MPLFNLQGKIYLSKLEITNTLRQAPFELYYVGATPNLAITLETERFPHYEAESGNRLQDFVLEGGKSGNAAGSLENLSVENLELVMHGSQQAQAVTPVVDMAAPDTIADGDMVALPDVNVGSVSITDSAGTPATLPAGQYTVDGVNGTITFDDVTTGGPYTTPFLISYTPGAATSVPMFTASAPVRLLKFDGINTVDDKRVILELYRVRVPANLLDSMKHEEGVYGSIPFNPEILADTTRPTSDVLGQYGRIIDPSGW